MASYQQWTLFVSLLCLVSATMGAPPRKPISVPFGRNYQPTWAFDHIKYFNGGNEIQLHLDKYTGRKKKRKRIFCIILWTSFQLSYSCMLTGSWVFIFKGTGFQSKGNYLFGHFHMQIKLVPGDSAGTVTAYYVSIVSQFLSFPLKNLCFGLTEVWNFEIGNQLTNVYMFYMYTYAAIFSKRWARWDRLWVPGKQDRAALHFADQCVHRRKGW